MISTQLSGDILKPQFMEQLHYLRERSKCHEEKDRCDHLAACLLLSSKLIHNTLSQPADKPKGRPKTAMAALGGNTWDPYETTMNREYTHKISSTQALRPQTSKGYRNPYNLSDPAGMSMYSDEFGWKPYSKPELIRAATSSGMRSNNPQANEAFKVWKLSREEQKAAFDTCTPLIRAPTVEDFQRAMKAQFSSTYRGDFLGIPQGFQVKYALTPTLNWKKQIPRPPDTESRFHYQIQPQAPELQNFTYKYGCYANRHLPAKGVVPTVLKSHIQNQEHRKQLTTYQRHFGKEYIDFSSLVGSMSPEELNTFLYSVSPEEKAAVERILISITGRGYQNLERKPPQMKVHGHRAKPKK
ncbi:hypothetical protein XELAEV_18013730mg [Xenopus laevis]|uniref:Testis-expressed protein 26 n=1 Tax=Xenopus laevis TaxID=8355 RepID=A0A974HZM7_XENLA|nr:hypothetical protein XELAEV_18013730mg [Xenopus laevis]